MELHGARGDLEVVGDLVIGAPGGRELHHLALAGRERGEAVKGSATRSDADGVELPAS